jgi:hypothetical protein
MASLVVAGVLVAGFVAGCAGQTGNAEGEGCTGADDCNNQLVCQPVTGRNGDFCCPMPLQYPSGGFASSQTNCQPTSSK